MKLVHSTSLNNFLDIIKGSVEKPTGIWHVSHGDDLMYFYHMEDALENCWSYDSDEIHAFMSGAAEIENHVITEWNWHGRMVLANDNEFVNNIAVTFIVDVPEQYYDLIEIDKSCPGMEMCRTIPCDEFDPSWITAIYTCHVPVQHYPFIMGSITHNDCADIDTDHPAYQIAKIINKSEDMYSLFLENIEYRFQEFKHVKEFKLEYSDYFMKDAA